MTRSGVGVGLLITGLSVMLLALSGCSRPAFDERTTQMEHDKAKAEVEALYDRTVAIVGEDGWKIDTREWAGCGRRSLRDTDSWARFSQRIAPLDASPQQVAERVADAWIELGYDVTVVTDDTLTPPRKIVSYPAYLTGMAADGFGATFSVGEGYADLGVDSRCVPSDPSATRYPSAVDG